MSEAKRLNGSGKKPYTWQDKKPVRKVQTARKTQMNKPAPKSAWRNAEHWLPKIAVAELVAVALVCVFMLISSNAEKSRLEATTRRSEELRESIEAMSRTLEMESRSEVICQKAEERLYMVRPSQSIALNMGGENQTAGR